MNGTKQLRAIQHAYTNSRLFAIGKIILVALLLFAYLDDLGYTPLDTETDEARRALVSVEMMLSGDYATPTLNGIPYLNKPPLYNWIVICYFKLFGNYSMFAFRLPVIVAVIGLGITIFYFVRKYTNEAIAFFTAWAFITNGRILIYDSLQGLIDTTFSWVVFTGFMLVFYYGEKKKYAHLFILTYILTALGYLMKGLPSVAFQGITLLTYFIWRRQFRILFKPAHFIGVFIFLVIVGAYYLVYFNINSISPETLFSNIYVESSKRTGVQFGLGETLLHILTFPFEMMYHFAPWTIFVIVLFQKNVWGIIKKNRFIQYCVLIFITNIILYWSSPQVYARYLFVFIPLLFGTWFYLFFDCIEKGSWQSRFMNWFIIIIIAVLTITTIVLPFINAVNHVNNFYIKYFFLVLAFGITLLIVLRHRSLYLYMFLTAIIISRIAFNWFVVEQRGARYFKAEEVGAIIAELTKGNSLYILQNAQVGNFDGMSFHISTRRGEILKTDSVIQKNAFYIADVGQLKIKPHTSYIAFTNYLADSLELVKFNVQDTVHAKR